MKEQSQTNKKKMLLELMKNPDVISVIGVKNIQALIKLQNKIEDALDNPEFIIREFLCDNKAWIGLLFRKKDNGKPV